ncbi:MAG: hypothetical protein OEY38_12130 [Gammaproteobacteria bacterium]|nr:hypothetical protein [Gammaproteobacteria bacterium]
MDNITLRWHWLGLGALGLLVGYFVALSESPVVATLLPLLFGVIAAASAFILGKTNISKPDEAEKIKIWGIGFFSFSVAVLGAASLGLLLKNMVYDKNSAPLNIAGINAQLSTELISLRKQLQILGASSEEQTAIIGQAKLDWLSQSSVEDNKKALLKSFVPAATNLQKALNLYLQKNTQKDEETLDILKKLSTLTNSTLPVLEEWTNGQPSSLGGEGLQVILLANESLIDELLGSNNDPEARHLLNMGADKLLVGSLFQVKGLLNRQFTNKMTGVNNQPSYSDANKMTELLISGKLTQRQFSRLLADTNSPSIWSNGGV